MSIALRSDSGGTSGAIQINGVDKLTIDSTGKATATSFAGDGSQLTGIPAPITTKLVTDSTDIVLNDIASGYNNVGSSFSVNIPANGIISAVFTGRFRIDSTGTGSLFLGIRIGATNYWFSENTIISSGSGPNTFRARLCPAGPTINDYVELKSNNGGAGSYGPAQHHSIGIAAHGIPTGTQTVQVIAARDVNASGSLRGTTTTSRVVLEFVSAS